MRRLLQVKSAVNYENGYKSGKVAASRLWRVGLPPIDGGDWNGRVFKRITGHAELTDTIGAARSELVRAEAGDLGDPRAHLRHASRPQPPEERRYGMIVEVWSALSASLLLIAVVALLYLKLVPIWAAILIALVGYIVLESLFRRRFLDLLLRVTVFLALVGALILVVTNAWLLVLAVVLVIAVLTLVDNFREIRVR
jgi:lysylphosphatidylglycerol synthetase-like protein (DUF2156 family)